MLLDREDARKLADIIGKKMTKNPGKWRAIAREVSQRAGCTSPFGTGDNLPLPGEAAHALNFMHHAVRGVRPYPENGSGGSTRCDPPTYMCGNAHAETCGALGTYNVCDCEDEGYTACKVCVSPTVYGCEGVFKCESEVSCDTFSCTKVYWQKNQGCTTGDTHTCGSEENGATHMCNESSNPYGCKQGDEGGFDDYNCVNTYACAVQHDFCKTTANFTCDGEKYMCQLDHECGEGATNEFECSRPTGFTCETACEQPYNGHSPGFECMPGFSV